MRYTGLTAEILINILFITAVAMFLIGIIAIKVNERIALEGNVESVKSLAAALEDTYFRQNDIEGGVGFLKKALNPGSSVAIIANDSGILLNRSSGDIISSTTDPLIKEALSSGETAVDIEGVIIPPFSSYKGFKVALPVR